MARVDDVDWNDSALVDSWNDALNEYKKYHSIRAKGGSIRDLEREIATAEASPPDGAESTGNGGSKASGAREGGLSQDEEEEEGEIRLTDEEHQSCASSAEGPNPSHGNNGIHQYSAQIPTHAVLGSVQDDNLKRLLMAWYYAGYYMGLYEGHQQAQQTPC
ncbi:survival motor neuron-like protein 1 [Ophiocordyceps camponoti-floridani]|uniref:Survival motor neuron-like protein 1 n=1 Tax=Ophiocordyceps camponoti-floridani TaxID=2030778 RepID=A0A8H4Q6J9_9HYPO|nr:survival motor neuron-like protein 1 [Ophiocordyceps camponoti-floridani]